MDAETKRKFAEIGEPFLTPEEATANAHLISAAPDMYEALQPFAELAKASIEEYERQGERDENIAVFCTIDKEVNLKHLRQLLTALAKAEGAK